MKVTIWVRQSDEELKLKKDGTPDHPRLVYRDLSPEEATTMEAIIRRQGATHVLVEPDRPSAWFFSVAVTPAQIEEAIANGL